MKVPKTVVVVCFCLGLIKNKNFKNVKEEIHMYIQIEFFKKDIQRGNISERELGVSDRKKTILLLCVYTHIALSDVS